jgi:hypothetical protein
MGYLQSGVTEKDTTADNGPLLKVDIRGNMEALAIVPLPFYSRKRGNIGEKKQVQPEGK